MQGSSTKVCSNVYHKPQNPLQRADGEKFSCTWLQRIRLISQMWHSGQFCRRVCRFSWTFSEIRQLLFYSAPSIFAVFRNLVRKIWFKKSDSREVVLQTRIFFWFKKSRWPEKRWVYIKNIKIRVCRTTFLEPLFYTF